MKMKQIMSLTGGVAAIIIITAILEVFWADWIIKNVYNKDINNWSILGVMILLALIMPKSLKALPFTVLLLHTVYIWVAL